MFMAGRENTAIPTRIRKLTSDTLTLAFTAGAVSSLSNLLILPVVIFHLSPEEFGFVGLVLFVSMISSTSFLLGTHSSISVNYHSQKDFGSNETLLGNIIIVAFTIWFLSLSAVYLLESIFGLFNLSNETFAIVAIISISQSIELVAISSLKIRAQNSSIARLSLLKASIQIILVLYLASIDSLDEISRLATEAIVFSTSMLFCTFYIYDKVSLSLDFVLISKITKFGFPILLHTFFIAALFGLDRVMIEFLVNREMLGIYTLGYSIAMILSFFTESVSSAWTSYFYESNSTTNSSGYGTFLATYPVISVLIAICHCMLIMSIPIIVRLFSIEGAYSQSVDIIPLISLGILLHGNYLIFTKTLVWKKKTALLATTSGISVLVNIILNFLLIPVYGISGAAVATVISYASIFLLGLFFSQKVHYIGFPLKITFASISFAVIFTLLQLSEEIPKRIEMLSESLILLFIIGLLMLSLHSLRKSLN